MPKETNLITRSVIEPVQRMKLDVLGNHNPRLHSDEVLVALSISAAMSGEAARAVRHLADLRGAARPIRPSFSPRWTPTSTASSASTSPVSRPIRPKSCSTNNARFPPARRTTGLFLRRGATAAAFSDV
jgi:hypothetical protein